MALRDQPYLPLYVQDILTDEKLAMCSAESHGVYLLLLCLLHKQENYGEICLKQKYKQKQSKYENFAHQICRQMPFEANQIASCLQELHSENVIQVSDTTISQKRMVKDGKISLIRSEIGKTGGSKVTKQYGQPGCLYLMSDGFEKNKVGVSRNPQSRLYRLRCDLKLPKHFTIQKTIDVPDMGKAEDLVLEFFKENRDGEWILGQFSYVLSQFDLITAKIRAKDQANTENEIETVIEDNKDIEDRGVGKGGKGKFTPPTPEEVSQHISSMIPGAHPEFLREFSEQFISHYDLTGWKYGKSKTPITNWKLCIPQWEPKRKYQEWLSRNPKKIHKPVSQTRTAL